MRFAIKDLLCFTALIGMLVGWYLDHQKAAARQQADWEALSSIDMNLQGSAHYLKEFQQNLDELEQNQQATDVR